MRFLRLDDLIELTGLSKSYLYQKIASGEFPPPVKVGRRSLWVSDEVERVMSLWLSEAEVSRIRSEVQSLIGQRKHRADIKMYTLEESLMKASGF